MADSQAHLSHLLVENRSTHLEFDRPGMGNPKINPVKDRAAHGAQLISDLESAFSTIEEEREHFEDELRATGAIITLEGVSSTTLEGVFLTYPLKIDSLESLTSHQKEQDKKPRWLLLSVTPADEILGAPERAIVWVSDDYRAKFLQKFEEYLEKNTSKSDTPRNRELVANIARIRAAVLDDLWQSSGRPPTGVKIWWEIWLHPDKGASTLLRQFCSAFGIRFSARILHLLGRDVMWVEATWSQIEPMPFTAVPVSEIRRPEFIDSIGELSPEEQAEYVENLVERLTTASLDSPAVCHLDSGVARTHTLLEGSMSADDLHTVIGTSGFDIQGHGTKMAGIALFGDAMQHDLVSNDQIRLRHRLESVRILPNHGETQHDPVAYGDVTAQAISLPEIVSQRQRVFCMPISAPSDATNRPGQPTLWSSTIDALAAGINVTTDGDELRVLGPPETDAARLIVVSAGNVDNFVAGHLDESDTSAIEDPGQAWNALTVGAYTALDKLPSSPTYEGWSVVAKSGDLSPHSRTSVMFESSWPIKPDIVMEGGNVLHDGETMFEPNHPVLSLSTTGHASNLSLTSANATSAATAQASRLSALVMSTYPDYWPETVRALVVHAAEWTPAMQREIDRAGTILKKRRKVLQRYGWGVPNENRALYSSHQAVTLVIQDEFVPFVGKKFKMPDFRMHDLPWPKSVLEDLGATSVTLRVTLSYFIEPTVSRRGWRQRYSYSSHGLRFDVSGPQEQDDDFVDRVNRRVKAEESGSRPPSGGVSWMIGPNQRNNGSLHQDMWETSGVELASSGKIAVYPVGGWWKKNSNRGRIDQPVRYALIVSLKTTATDVDLYTPIANELRVPIEVSGT